jgi:hypothetical protein
MPSFLSLLDNFSELSIEAVPTRIGAAFT